MEAAEVGDDWPSQEFRDKWIEELKKELIKNYDPTLQPPENPLETEAQVFGACSTKESYVLTMEGIIQKAAGNFPAAPWHIVTVGPWATPEVHTVPEEKPITKFLASILQDPAFLKLFAILASILSLAFFSTGHWQAESSVPFIVVNSITLIYSIISLLVEVTKSEDTVVESVVLKKVFNGRSLQWQEIHASASLAIMAGNFSMVTLINRSYNTPALAAICILTNIGVFGIGWFRATKKVEDFESEVYEMECQCWLKKWILDSFRKFPRIFNLIRLTSIIASLVLSLVYYELGSNAGEYFIFVSSALILTSGFLTLIQLGKPLNKKLASKVIKETKIEAYLSIILTVFSVLLLLASSLIINYKSHYIGKGYPVHYTRDHFAISCPISFGLTVFAFIISLLDLYSQACFYRTGPCQLVMNGEGNKNQNLPSVIGNPFIEKK